MVFSKNFGAADWGCRCGCGYGTQPDDACGDLCHLLEMLRSIRGDRPIHLTSGCRCETHNLIVGGKRRSAHTRGKAADIRVSGGRERWETLCGLIVAALAIEGDLRVSADQALHTLRTTVRGLGIGADFIHVDCDEELTNLGLRPSAWGYQGITQDG